MSSPRRISRPLLWLAALLTLLGAALMLFAGRQRRLAGRAPVILPLGTPPRVLPPPPPKTAPSKPVSAPRKRERVSTPVAPAKSRVTKLSEKGESIFGAR